MCATLCTYTHVAVKAAVNVTLTQIQWRFAQNIAKLQWTAAGFTLVKNIKNKTNGNSHTSKGNP